jgi:hypothetical protein
MQHCATVHAAYHEVHSVRADVANRQGGGRVDPGQLPLNGRLRGCRIASDAQASQCCRNMEPPVVNTQMMTEPV